MECSKTSIVCCTGVALGGRV